MNIWNLCDGVWVNFDLLKRIGVRAVACTEQYEIIGVPENGEDSPLFDRRYFDSQEEAEDFLNNFMLTKKNNMRGEVKEENIFKEVLFDFMRELPLDIHIGKLSIKEASDIIDEFMKKHGLNDDEWD